MATVSIPTRSGSLAEAQTRVRHPLARVRTIIRAYVGLEGAALLFTLLALWFWVTFATDFGAFRSVGVDWVQWVSRPVRALVLGGFFLAAVFCLRSGLIMRMIGPDLVAIYSAALALGKRQTLPVWLRLPLLGMLVAIIGLAFWGIDVLLASAEASTAAHGMLALMAGIVVCLTAFLLSGCHEVFGVRNRSSLPMMLRAPLAAVGSGFGAFVGYLLGMLVGNLAFAALFAALLAPVGDVAALCMLSFGALLLRGRGLAFLITSSLALCYLALWVGLGVLVGWVSSDWSPWVGAVGVAFLLIAPVVFVIVSRLTTDFRDSAIALVLERRFPKVLGDRLITAIDLAEPKKHVKYGYSLPMMEATIRDAAERVDQVPVASVFDWFRLSRYFVMVVVCTLGFYLFLVANAVRVGLDPADSSGVPIMVGVWLVNVFLLAAAGYLMVRRGGVAGIFLTCLLVFVFLWAYVDSALTHILAGPGGSFQSTAVLAALAGLVGCIAFAITYVFVRKRLRSKVDLLLAAVTVAIILGVTGSRAGDASDNAKAINETASLWMERNVFLQNTIWPRRAHLIVLDPSEEDKRVGKDDAAPTLRVRALHWVVVDPKSDEGWRALTWHDLETNKALLGETVPALTLPTKWAGVRQFKDWTIDELELRLDQVSAHEDIDAETAKLLRDTISEKLEARAADPAMRRTLRKLIVPPTIAVTYWGDNTRGTMNLSRAGENEYTGPFPALKESVRYSARGEDYTTPTRKITVVPPPSLIELTSEEHRAAYHFYRVADGEQDQLKGLKQTIPPIKLSLLGGDTTRIEGVFAGSDVILTAKTDKDLNLTKVSIEPFRAGAPAIVGEVSVPEKRTIRVVFNNVRSTPQQPSLDFVLKYVDSEGVSGARHIVLKPVDDNPPDVNVGYEVLRKTPTGIMITPVAKIPLGGSNFTDDVGLTGIEYVMTYSKLDRGAEATARGLVVLSALQKIAGGPGQEYAAASEVAKIARDLKANAGNEGEKTYGPMVYKPFETELKASQREFYRIDDLLRSLGTQPPRTPLTKKYVIPDKQDPYLGTDYFIDVEALRVGVDETKMTQPRYRMQFWMEATDNNVDSGPGRGIAKEKLTFVIVPENELLAEIAKEQDGIYTRLLDSATKLQETVAKLNQMKSSLLSDEIKDDQLKSMVIRCEDLLSTLGKTEADVAAAHADLSRILLEIKQNRVQQSRITKLEREIVDRLQEGLKPRDDKAVDNFPKCKDGVDDLRGILNGNDLNLGAKIANSRKATDIATDRLNSLLKRLNDVLDQMREIGGMDELISKLVEIDKEEERQKAILRIMEYYAKDKTKNSIFGEEKPK